VYNILSVVLIIFFIRVFITASICHYIFNATCPIVLESVMGKGYDRKTFRSLPFSTMILLVIMVFVLFPSR
jgi:hypothetical protein